MIKGNIIEFGYGDVVISSNSMLEYIKFTNIAPPMKCGAKVTSDLALEYGESITIYGDGDRELYNLIKTVDRNNTIVKYKGYVLDFSNYNEKSIEIALKHSRNMINWMALAC